MDIDACYQFGHVIKTHGLKGEIKILIDVDYPAEYDDLESVYVEINYKLVPFFIDKFNLQGDKAIIKFNEVDSIDEASRLKSKRLFLPLASLPALATEKYYAHMIIGYDVIDLEKGKLGKVLRVDSSPGQDVMVVECKNKEILIPMADDLVKETNHDKMEINVNLPAGLLDIYLS